MISVTAEDVRNMTVALAIYRIGLTDLRFRDDEKEDESLRDQTLVFVSEVIGPKIVHMIDQVEASLREVASNKENDNGK